MNVSVENLAPCKKLVRVELEAKQVDETFDSITKDFQRQASLPGFRPGKAPRDMVIRKYEKDISDEVKRKLIGDSYRKALDEKKLDVVGYPDIEEIQFGRGQALQFAATIETAPEFELPEYELQRLSFPPILQILDYIQQEGFTELVISTPGPVGLVALLAAKILGLRTVGIYHTDFPQYVRILTDDSLMETLTWNFMHWFYSQLDVIYVNSEGYRECWEERGIAPEKLKILPRGLDTELFHPSRRSVEFWRSRGLRDGETGILYVGRVSREKNLDVLVSALKELRARNIPVRALFVGDGPYLKEMKRLLPDAIFTGYLAGAELASAYASADFFVFPSTTDTFGNVVIEAQAAGLPVIVTDAGGPRDLVADGKDGIVVRGMNVGDLVKGIETLQKDADLRKRFGDAARKKVESRDWSSAFEKFWDASSE